MLVNIPIVLVLASIAPVSASSHSSRFSRAAKHVHKVAQRHSAGLARDLRVAMKGIFAPQQLASTKQQVYCVSSHPSGPGSSGGGGSTGNGTSSGKPTGTATSSGPKSTSTSTSSPWKLVESHQGNDFFNGWDFWNLPDPTHGLVNFLSQSDAQNSGLISVNNAGNAIMKVDTTPVVTGARNSVRITTQNSFTGALFVMDAVHMPTGCGTWPAFWSNGPNWPAGGEIDIVEGINDYTNNQATVHTNPGCQLASSTPAVLGISGNVVGGTDCSAIDTGNQGCGVRSTSSSSFGKGFNEANGGVYAMQWDDSGIQIYFFPRGSIPSDLDAETPQPSNWGQPLARWPSGGCDPYEFFYNHVVIFDTTLCGDWAGTNWASSGLPGQEQSCAERTGFSTCEAFVLASGASFSEAYWEVSSLKIYQTSRKT